MRSPGRVPYVTVYDLPCVLSVYFEGHRAEEGASTDIYIPHLFGPGPPVLVPGFQWSGWSNSGIHGQIRVRDGQIRASQGLSTRDVSQRTQGNNGGVTAGGFGYR